MIGEEEIREGCKLRAVCFGKGKGGWKERGLPVSECFPVKQNDGSGGLFGQLSVRASLTQIYLKYLQEP